MAKEGKHPGGRPTKFTKILGYEICQRIAGGESLRKICDGDEFPYRQTVHDWLLTNKEFYDQYERACNARAENMFDELEEIADLPDADESPMRSRLRVDTRKWYLSKVLPKKFGDKIDVTSGNKPIPLLNAIRDHNRDAENSEPQEKD